MDVYAAAAQAPNTTRAYRSDWAQFEAWCERYRLAALPAQPAVAALYLTALARRGLKLSTVRRRAAAITRADRLAGLSSPIWDPRVMTLLEGIARTLGPAPQRKSPCCASASPRLVERIDPAATAGLRDRALILVGFSVGLRRSELVALAVEDLSPPPRRAHGAQRALQDRPGRPGHGAAHGLRPARAALPRARAARLARPLPDHRGRRLSPRHPHRRHHHAAHRPVRRAHRQKRRVAGLDPAALAGHSLRSGFATQAARDGHHAAQIADVTRHRDRRVLDGYIQAGRGAQHVARVL